MTKKYEDIELEDTIILRSFLKTNPAVEELGDITIKLHKKTNIVEIFLPIEKKHTNGHGIIHGGILTTLLDTAMGYACYSIINQNIVTLNINTSFIRNCKPGTVIKTIGKAVNIGKTIIVAQGQVYDDKDTLLTDAQGTFFVLKK